MRAPSINTCKNLNRHDSVTLDRNVREKTNRNLLPFETTTEYIITKEPRVRHTFDNHLMRLI